MFILLFLLWVALNGRFTLEIAIIGVIVCGGVYWFCRKHLDYNPPKFRNIFKSIVYIFVLLVEIIKSSISVLKFVFVKNIEIDPQIKFFKVNIKSEFLRTVLANSISLTPGTITVNVDEDIFCVHALDYTLLEGIEDSIFIRLLKEMDGEK